MQKNFKKNTIMKNQKNKNLTSWDNHLDEKYGKIGTPKRDKYEQGFEAFKLGVLIQEARKKRHLTQEELAFKVGTTKSYISRIENDASDIRLSTLMRIIREGLGGHLKLTLDLK
jgi:HTH-type transcriptional regulator/antitoxin HipB